MFVSPGITYSIAAPLRQISGRWCRFQLLGNNSFFSFFLNKNDNLWSVAPNWVFSIGEACEIFCFVLFCIYFPFLCPDLAGGNGILIYHKFWKTCGCLPSHRSDLVCRIFLIIMTPYEKERLHLFASMLKLLRKDVYLL